MNLKPLLSWSTSEFRQLPWRQNRSLYRTLVSEIMLQQTTVGTVLNHYERFLKRFPTLKSLAVASEEELTIAWKGLGYYRRARNLKKIAETIQFEHDGIFPNDLETLMSIPGIGPYTANAIIAIGMDKRGLAVDANLERVIARVFEIQAPKGIKLQKEIQEKFKNHMLFNQKVSWRGLNEALMDLGRTYCQARRVNCELCPLSKSCKSLATGNMLELPLNTNDKKKEVEHTLHLLRVFVLKKEKTLAYLKNDKEWLSGQYEVPSFVIESSDTKMSQYPKLQETLKYEILFSYKTNITKYKIKNSVVIIPEKEFKKSAFSRELVWLPLQEESSNFSTATAKAIAKLPKSK